MFCVEKREKEERQDRSERKPKGEKRNIVEEVSKIHNHNIFLNITNNPQIKYDSLIWEFS